MHGRNSWILFRHPLISHLFVCACVCRIFHVLDLPLYPPFISDFTEFMAFSTTWDSSDCYRLFTQSTLSSKEISLMFNSTLTMFCPTREAFANFNNEDFQRLLEPMWVRHATELLLNHITMPALTRAELVDQAPTMLTMLNGAQYELKRSGDLPRIKNTKNEQARSEFGDVIALDGYVSKQRGALYLLSWLRICAHCRPLLGLCADICI